MTAVLTPLAARQYSPAQQAVIAEHLAEFDTLAALCAMYADELEAVFLYPEQVADVLAGLPVLGHAARDTVLAFIDGRGTRGAVWSEVESAVAVAFAGRLSRLDDHARQRAVWNAACTVWEYARRNGYRTRTDAARTPYAQERIQRVA